MGTIILVRHGQSQWNLENRFTGWVDVDLSSAGREEARGVGIQLKGIKLDLAFTSILKRAEETLSIILNEMNCKGIPISRDQALNERNYGDLQGLNKAETAKKYGDEQVRVWRRSYAVKPPNGESLKDTAQRTLPYFKSHVLPQAQEGKNVLVAAHGNSLRAIVMELDRLTPEEIVSIEIATGQPWIYEIGPDAHAVSKKILPKI